MKRRNDGEAVRTELPKLSVEHPYGSLGTLFKALSCLSSMDCPHCQSKRVSFLQRKTHLGYAMFRCKLCRRTYNKRTGTPFNFIEVPTDIFFQVLLCRVHFASDDCQFYISGFCLLRKFPIHVPEGLVQQRQPVAELNQSVR